MAALTITASSVAPGAGAIVRTGTAGAAITAGQAVYKDAAGAIQLADANASALTAAAVGIAINTAAANQKISYVVEGLVTIGATVAVGDCFVVSATAGGVAPEADLTTGDYATLLGIGVSTTQIYVRPIVSGAQHA